RQAALPEGDRGVERVPQAVERRLTRVAEPRLLVEVVDRDEATAATPVCHPPVVAPAAHGRVLRHLDVEVPAAAEGRGDRGDLELVRRRPHPTTVRSELVGGERAGLTNLLLQPR